MMSVFGRPFLIFLEEKILPWKMFEKYLFGTEKSSAI